MLAERSGERGSLCFGSERSVSRGYLHCNALMQLCRTAATALRSNSMKNTQILTDKHLFLASFLFQPSPYALSLGDTLLLTQGVYKNVSRKSVLEQRTH